MTLNEIFSTNKDIVINTDIDGFLSGMFLQEYYGCNVVGFTNSKDKVWLKEGYDDLYAPVYIDMYVANPNTICIDQHVLAYDETHRRNIIASANGRKLNPNLDRGVTFLGNYTSKYPFGTIHYLLALMDHEGIDVKLPDLNAPVMVTLPTGNTFVITPGQVLMRADDACFTSKVNYVPNANSWWQWLNPNHANKSITSIQRYLATRSSNRTIALQEKGHIATFFKDGFGCEGGDGAYDRIFANPFATRGTIRSEINAYVRAISNMMGKHLTLPQNYVEHSGNWVKEHLGQNIISSIPNLYSYAIIAGPGGYSGKIQLSYTTNMR